MHIQKKLGVLLWGILLLLLTAGCASSPVHTVVPDYDERGIRLIALMPVDNKSDDPNAASVLRREILESLYFKGYPKIPLTVVDERIALLDDEAPSKSEKTATPQAMGRVLGVDAALYCTLTEWDTDAVLIYGSTSVAASFELRSAKTGEMLWSASEGHVDRHYDVGNTRLRAKSLITIESVAREMVDKAMATFPDGPEAIKRAPPISKKSKMLRWFRKWW